MSWWLLASVTACALAAIVSLGWLAWRHAEAEVRQLARRIAHLSFRSKLALAADIATDRRLPRRARVIPPLLVLYLAMPLDIVPDFIPVFGQLDDLVVLIVGVSLLRRLTPRIVIEEHLARLESQ